MTILPKAIYRFNVIPTKLSMAFFTKLEQMLRFVQKHKTIAKTIWIKKWSWRNHNSCLQTICKSNQYCPGTETVEQINALGPKAQK